MAFYGKPQRETMRAVVALKDDRPIGICGVTRKCGVLMIFSEITPEMRAYPKQILKAGHMLMDMVRGLPVKAVADPSVPSSARFLEKLGFEHIGTCSDGEVFSCG